MSVEYRYYNKINHKYIELGKDFCVGSNAWYTIFYDFKTIGELYSLTELISIIKNPLVEHENFMKQHDIEYKLDWIFWNNYIIECAKNINEFLNSDIIDNFYLISDDGISIDAQSFIEDDNELSFIYKEARKPENKIWSRYKNNMYY